MTAGSGLVHEEFHSREASAKGGVVSMAQLWVNLPKRDKNAAPRYQTITDGTIPRVPLPEGAGEVRVIAGSFGEHRGPAETFTPVDVWDIRLTKGASVTLPLKDGFNAVLPVLEGAISVDGKAVGPSKTVLFDRKGESITVTATEDSQLLLLGGEPLDEPIAHYGPFVMNTQEEIRQAIDDFRRGKMGDL